MIPKGIPEYSRAVEHAAKGHYFFASETVTFSFEIWCRNNAYGAEEFETELIFTDAYGEPVDDAEFTLSDPVTQGRQEGSSPPGAALPFTGICPAGYGGSS